MAAFLARRIAAAAILVLMVASAALVLVHAAPGDAFSRPDIDPELARAERARLGLDRPFSEQYGRWLARGLRLDLGESTRYRRPVTTLLAERVPRTLILGVTALTVALALGIPLGVAAGAPPRRWWTGLVGAASVFLVSIPPLVMSLLLLLLAARTGWLPAGGLGGAPTVTAAALVLPVLALALPLAATIERLQSSAVDDAFREPCIRAALARGVSERRVAWNHALRLAIRPLLGVFGIIVGTVLSGSLVIEIVMSWPGVGDLMYQALLSRDLHLAAGCAAVASATLAAGVLLSDVAIAAIDPRVRETT